MAVEFVSTSPGFLMLAPTAVQTVTAPTALVPPEATRHHYVATCASLGTWLFVGLVGNFVFSLSFPNLIYKTLFATRSESFNCYLKKP